MAQILAALAGVSNVMQIMTFIQFIEEEAIQSASLGVFLAVRSKSYGAGAKGIILIRGTLLPNLKSLNEVCGWMAPYSKGCFEDFIKATELNLEIYEDALFAHKT